MGFLKAPLALNTLLISAACQLLSGLLYRPPDAFALAIYPHIESPNEFRYPALFLLLKKKKKKTSLL